jgi:Ni,Fe-hydrogenase III small subunit
MSWFWRGLIAGTRTERYDEAKPAPAGATPGMPETTAFSDASAARELAALCPTGAIEAQGETALLDRDRCVHCLRCAPERGSRALTWNNGFAWAHAPDGNAVRALPTRFRRSMHVRVVDAGDCGSCLNEIAHLNDPFYNMHRFGFFITPTPRQADVLLVVGPVTQQMREALLTAYQAMPEPKRVVAVGVCAVSGGIFGPSVMCAAGAGDVLPVDIVVPGCPPPPLAILNALMEVCNRKP